MKKQKMIYSIIKHTNMQLSCYIVDDEIHAVGVLRKYIEKTPGLFLVGSETNPLKAWNTFNSITPFPDIIFLDIDMPQLSGIELACLIKPAQIIFTTAHPDYALHAFDCEAIDYLLKPVPYERFLKAVNKANDKLLLKTQSSGFDPGEEDFYIKTEYKGKLVKLKYDDIYYIEAKANYLKFYLPTKFYMAYLTMKELEEQLPSKKFIRVHKSFIVNMNKITAIDGIQVTLENNDLVNVGRSYRNMLLSVINPKLISSKRLP